MLFCCHMPPAPLPDYLPTLDYTKGPPSADAILGRLQVLREFAPMSLSCTCSHGLWSERGQNY